MSEASSSKKITIHTDGACDGNPGPGGWAALLRYGDHVRELAGGEPATTNNTVPRLFSAQDGVLGCLGNSEFHYALGGDLDDRSGSRVATHPSLAIYQDQFTQARERERVLGILISERHQGFESLGTLLLGQANGFRQ